MDAARLLIQLSDDSAESGGDAVRTVERSREESVGDSTEISSDANLTKQVPEPLPRRRKRFRSIVDIYSATSPITKIKGNLSIPAPIDSKYP
ncbi:hypothetical protein F511_24744 [Dorcoceras hygrometricum]|uniref:Uncharacterized protein n=1 Tax=Dorcoceras hygrometricum TaxID=472368 RepID=A0A2Z7AJ65_9LAMI|nr:hypothetical protein F511_24744 [Dorcoceras hygrometricum]